MDFWYLIEVYGVLYVGAKIDYLDTLENYLIERYISTSFIELEYSVLIRN